MRNLTALALTIFAFVHLTAQDGTRTIEWKDGTEMEYRLLDDQVKDYSRWNLTGAVIAGYNAHQFVPGFNVDANYEHLNLVRLNASAILAFPFEFAYAFEAEPVHIERYKESFRHYTTSASMRFFRYSFDMTLTKALYKRLSTGYVTSYYLKEQLEAEGSLHAVVGYDYLLTRLSREGRPLQSRTPVEDSINDVSYLGIVAGSHNLRLGVRYRMKMHWAYSLDKEVSQSFGNTDFYALVLVPVQNHLTAVKARGSDSGELVSGGYEEPDFSALGFIMGVEEVRVGNKLTVRFALEAGMLTGLVKEHNFYAGLKMGMGVGERFLNE